jgi:hypothetical protein
MPPQVKAKKTQSHPQTQSDLPDSPKLGRPEKPGAKSRDPLFRAWTGYLKKKTLLDADYQLKRTSDARDMSDLMQELLAEWLSKQPKN